MADAEPRGWDFDAITAKWQKRWWDEKIHHANRPPTAIQPWWSASAPSSSEGRGGPKVPQPSSTPASAGLAGERSEPAKPTFFIHFAYPGISGYLHVGHMRGFTYTDVFARYARMTGHDVLFPAGFHASGIPAVAFAAEVKRGEKTDYLRANGYTGPIEALGDPKEVVDYFAHVYTNDYWKAFGFLIDERRNCTTIDPAYSKFIQWQFRQLKSKGYLIQKPHFAPFCPVSGPVAVDKSETDIKQGGSAEILEFMALRFTLPAAAIDNEPVVLPCATLRPETVYGCTNVWIHPKAEYYLVRVWADGAVKDSDESELWLVSDQGRRKLEWQFERAEATGRRVKGESVLGLMATAPVTGRKVPVVAGEFVDPMIATGIVMSVPGHAPFDYAAYRESGMDESQIPQIVKVEGYAGLPAKIACAKHNVRSQNDKQALEAATEELYADEFNKGVLTDACGPYAGKRIKAIKDVLRADFTAQGHGRTIRQFSELVISRAGQIVDVKRVPDQDFIHYADKAWTEKAKAHAAKMNIFPARYKDEMPNVLDWFGDRACVRRGAWLGTEFPFKPGWIVEPIADSTFYPWFYIVQRYVESAWNPAPAGGGVREDELTDAFFDYVFNGKGKPARPLWDEVRRDVTYWGPVDINLGGKEHQTVHFPVYVMNMVALMDEPRLWPRGIFVNWWVTQKAGTKISKSKGGAEPIPGAAKRYGVDAMRLYYCHVGSPHVDIEWDPDVVMDYRRHLERLTRAVDDALAVKGGAGPMDAWLEAAFGGALISAADAYTEYNLRDAAGVLVFNVPDLLRWYAKRGGSNSQLLRRLLQDWAKALCPMVPHLAEEIFHRAGGAELASRATFLRPARAAGGPLAAEDYLRAVINDIQTVRKLAGIEAPRSLTLFTTPAWKRDLLARAVALADATHGRFPMSEFMRDVMADPTMRERGKEVQAFSGRIVQLVTQLAPSQRDFLQSGVDEAAVLAGAREFLAAELGIAQVEVHRADDAGAPQHQKRAVAAPFKPGIALA
jgi:leucyl-tRNA synthetase